MSDVNLNSILAGAARLRDSGDAGASKTAAPEVDQRARNSISDDQDKSDQTPEDGVRAEPSQQAPTLEAIKSRFSRNDAETPNRTTPPQIPGPSQRSAQAPAPSVPLNARADASRIAKATQQITNTKFSRPQTERPAGRSAIIISQRQKGNPVISRIRGVPYEYGETTADFVTGATSCVLFLSLEYHKIHLEYIYTRMKKVGRDFDLRILLVLVDIENHDEYLRNLTRVCMHNDFTMVLAWSKDEAANYLVRLKMQETAKATAIMGRTPQTYNEQLVEFLTKVRSVNSSDAYSLVSHFGTLKEAILNGSTDKYELVPRWGHRKASALNDTVTQKFIHTKEYNWPE